MSKQYLTAHTVENAHITEIFSLATAYRCLLSASGSSALRIYDTTSTAFPLTQSISGAHKLGCHHLCASDDGLVAASAGFGGEVKIWTIGRETGEWSLKSQLPPASARPGEVWALALSTNGQYLASTTHDGRINVWDIADAAMPSIQCYDIGSLASASFGMCVAMSRDGTYTASGHQNGAVYVFKNDTRRLIHTLPGLAKPVRAVAFSPGGTRLAAAGDAGIIALYDIKHGEQVGNLTGHSSWITSIDWNETGEYLLSGSMDGKVKVWSVQAMACVATHSDSDKALWAGGERGSVSATVLDEENADCHVRLSTISPVTVLSNDDVLTRFIHKQILIDLILSANMPTTRRSTGSTRAQAGAPRCQTTLSFAHRVTKPGVRDPSKKAAAALPISKKSVSPSRDAKPSLTADEEVPLDRRPDEEAATTPEALVVEKSEAQVKAEAITEAQVSRYWKAIEKKRIAERVHQDDLGLEEKILRYFDVSSQYGPCTGISRLRRWERANGLGLSPPTEVLAVLMRGLSRGDDRATVAYMDEILGFRALGQLENTAE